MGTSRPKTRSLALTSSRGTDTTLRHGTGPSIHPTNGSMVSIEEELLKSSSIYNKFLSVTSKRHNFQLNKNKALKKKMSACDRPVMCESTENDGLITVRCQTGIYELLRRAILTYYSEPQLHGLTASIELWQDQACNNTQAAIKVSQMHSHRTYYTVCLYHTTSTICINGMGTKKFFERDWTQLEQIIYEMNQVRKSTDPHTLNISFKTCLQEVLDVLGMPKKRKDGKASHSSGKYLCDKPRNNEDHHHLDGLDSPNTNEQQQGRGLMPHRSGNVAPQLAAGRYPSEPALINKLTPPRNLEARNTPCVTDIDGRSWSPIGRHEQPSGSPVSGLMRLTNHREEGQLTNLWKDPSATYPVPDLPYTHTAQNVQVPNSQGVPDPLLPRDNIGRHEQPRGLPEAGEPEAGEHRHQPGVTIGSHEQPSSSPPTSKTMARSHDRTPTWPSRHGPNREEGREDSTSPLNIDPDNFATYAGRLPPPPMECPDCHRYKTKMEAMELDYQGLTKKIKTQEKALAQREKELSTKGTQYASARTHITALEAQIKQLQDTNTLLTDRVAILETRRDGPAPNKLPSQKTNSPQEDRISRMERQLQEMRITQLEMKMDNMARQSSLSSGCHLEAPPQPRPETHTTHHHANYETGPQQYTRIPDRGPYRDMGPMYTQYHHSNPPQPWLHHPIQPTQQYANPFLGQNLYMPANGHQPQQTFRRPNHTAAQAQNRSHTSPGPQGADPTSHGIPNAADSPSRKRRSPTDTHHNDIKRPKGGTHHGDELLQLHIPLNTKTSEQMPSEDQGRDIHRNIE